MESRGRGNSLTHTLIIKMQETGTIVEGSIGSIESEFLHRSHFLRNLETPTAPSCTVPVPVARRLRAGADVSSPGPQDSSLTELQAATQNGPREDAKTLLHAGAYINAPSVERAGRTALQAPAEGGFVDSDELGWDGGVDSNTAVQKSEYRTTVQAAANSGQTSIVEILLAVGPDINNAATGCSGQPALQAAVESGYMQILEIPFRAKQRSTLVQQQLAGGVRARAQRRGATLRLLHRR